MLFSLWAFRYYFLQSNFYVSCTNYFFSACTILFFNFVFELYWWWSYLIIACKIVTTINRWFGLFWFIFLNLVILFVNIFFYFFNIYLNLCFFLFFILSLKMFNAIKIFLDGLFRPFRVIFNVQLLPFFIYRCLILRKFNIIWLW